MRDRGLIREIKKGVEIYESPHAEKVYALLEKALENNDRILFILEEVVYPVFISEERNLKHEG